MNYNQNQSTRQFSNNLKELAQARYKEISIKVKQILELYKIFDLRTQKMTILHYLAYTDKLPSNYNLPFNKLVGNIEDLNHFKNYLYYAK